jgi:hypothetical protein
MSYGFNHQAGVKASPEEIYEALTESGSPSSYRRMRSRASFSFGTRAREKARNCGVIAPRNWPSFC